MMKRAALWICISALSVSVGACSSKPSTSLPELGVAPVPSVDHHQHLLSPEAADLVNRLFDLNEQAVDGAAMIRLLDTAGIKRAVILSNAYYFDAPETEQLPGSHEAVRRENDWTAAQSTMFPGRLVPFCSLNPLKDYAVAEVARCARNPTFRGLKLHFDTSGVDLRNADHLAKTQSVFRAASAHGLALHVHASRRASPPYGEADARIFISQLLTSAPDVPVVIAHLWGGGDYSPDALRVFADAKKSNDPRVKNLYFDVAQATSGSKTKAELDEMAVRLRQIGLSHVLYGSDGPQLGGAPPVEAWSEFRRLMPLTEAEVQRVATNISPALSR
jgi:predicted TIM-barrel fold metal-dependent hydrolase